MRPLEKEKSIKETKMFKFLAKFRSQQLSNLFTGAAVTRKNLGIFISTDICLTVLFEI